MAASFAGIKAGRAFILIEALDRTGAVMNRVGAKFKKWSMETARIGQSILMQGIAAMVPTGLALEEFREFDDAMKRVEARSRGTAQEMAAIRVQARELGKATAFSAGQVGELVALLAQKGFKRSDLLKMAPGVVSMALAGGEKKDLAEDAANAAELVSGTLRAYQMEATESARVADVFTAAMNNSNQTMATLITGMSYAGAVARRYKVSLEDTVAVLSMMRNINLDASITGTAFRNMLIELSDSKKRDKFNKMLESMTGKTIEFGDAKQNLRPIATILFEIGDAIRGLGTLQQGEILQILFGKRAIVPASALSEGRNAFKDLFTILKESGGVATTTATLLESGFGGAIRRFASMIGDLKIEIGESLDVMLVKLNDRIGELIDSWIEWIRANQTTVVKFTMLTTAAIALGASLIGLSAAMKTVSFALFGIATITGTLTMSWKMLKNVFFGTFKLIKVVVMSLFELTKVLRLSAAATALFHGVTRAFVLSMMAIHKIAVLAGTGVAILTSSLIGGMAALNAVIAVLMGFSWGYAAGGLLAIAAAVSLIAVASVAAMGPLTAMGTYISESLTSAWQDLKNTAIDFTMGTVGALWDLAKQGQQVGMILMDTFDAVANALAIGETEIAWRTAINGLQLAWLTATKDMTAAWHGFVAGIESSQIFGKLGIDAAQTETTIADAFRNIVHGWFKMIENIKTTWTGVQSELDIGIYKLQLRFNELWNQFSPRARMRDKGWRKIMEAGITGAQQEAGSAAGKNLKATIDAMEAYDAAVKRSTDSINEEIAKRREALEFDKYMIEWAHFLATVPDIPPAVAAAVAKIEDAAAVGGPKAVPSSIKLKALEAMELGSVETAKAVFEGMLQNLTVQKDVEQEQLDVLEDIRDNTEEFGMEGV